MTYAELLKTYIKGSKYTLDELTRLLLDKGISISREHLSRLQNGKVPPASREVTTALAEITGGNADKLLWLANVEKGSDILKDLANMIADEELENFLINRRNKPNEETSQFPFLNDLLKEIEIDDEQVEKALKRNSPFEKHGDSVAAYLLEHAKSILLGKSLNDIQINAAINITFTAFQTSLNQALLNDGSASKIKIEKEWALDYLLRLPIKEKLAMILGQLRIEIESKPYYSSLINLIELNNQIILGSTEKTELSKRHLINLVNDVKQAIKDLQG